MDIKLLDNYMQASTSFPTGGKTVQVIATAQKASVEVTYEFLLQLESRGRARRAAGVLPGKKPWAAQVWYGLTPDA